MCEYCCSDKKKNREFNTIGKIDMYIEADALILKIESCCETIEDSIPINFCPNCGRNLLDGEMD